MINKRFSNILLISSFSMFILSIFLYFLEFKTASLLYFILFLTSVNHWRNPNYDTKRIIDIGMVMITTCMGMLYATGLNSDLDFYMYYLTAFYTLLLFITSNLLFKQEYFLLSTLFHSKIHLICSIGNAMMFYCLKQENFFYL